MRAVILCDPRTASTMITRTLAEHPQLNVCADEPLHPDKPMCESHQIRSLGFDLAPVHRWQVQDPLHLMGLKVISLKRYDLLGQYQSWCKAMRSGIWQPYHLVSPDRVRDPKRTLGEFSRWLKIHHDRLDQLEQDALKIDFAEVANDPVEVLDRIQSFLALLHHPLRPVHGRFDRKAVKEGGG